MPLRSLRVGKDWWALAAAIVLPTAIFVFAAIGLGWRDQQAAIAGSTQARAALISDNVDRRLQTVATGLRFLGTIRAIDERDWREAAGRADEIVAISPGWRSVAMTDVDTDRSVVSTSGAPAAAVSRAALPPKGEIGFSAIETDAGGRAILRARMLVVHPSGRTLITIDVDPAIVQQELLRLAPTDGISAVVDRAGLFVARTRAWPERLGTPSSHYVRDAIRTAQSGVYRGRTLEGFDNYSAFVTSRYTGLSTHVAISSSLVDAPRRRWLVALGIAALASIALGGILTALVLRSAAQGRRAVERRDRSERLEAIGRLSSGIAHDFNNMLSIIVGSLDIAQRRLAAGNSDVGRYIANAQDGAGRAADLTKRLLSFSRNLPLTPAVVDPNDLVASLRDLLQRTLGERVTLGLDLEPVAWTILVDRSALENAIVNLCINASDAMPGGGAVTISTRNRPARATGSPPRPEALCIAVADQGTGMTEEVAARALEPFFTTKRGKGTGLGLSQVHGFITQSGGTVRIVTAPGQGTTVELYIPRHRTAAERQPASGDGPVRGHGETILVVDDEAGVRETTAAMLRDLGYEVIEADGAVEALAQVERHPTLRLLVTDIVMPGMDGRTLAAQPEIRARGIRSLLISGFDPDGAGADDVLAKPFTAEVLGARVSAALREN